jgi:RNA polymerase sigma factor (sigma-70 family)
VSNPTDQHLLSAWARQRDEAAFQTLVHRYGGFVYGAALRRVGDQGLAEEIAQDVFARLSTKAAALLHHPTIAGWLHRSAMLLALDRLRKRERRTRTLERLLHMNENSRANDPLEEMLPHLDEALDRLSTSEREMLMMHYAEKRTFPEIAKIKGTTPDAVRMRNNRALAALSRMLGRKKIFISTGVLATGLGGTFSQATPAGLMAFSPLSLASYGAVSPISHLLHTWQTVNRVKLVACTVTVAAVTWPLAFQANEIRKAERQLSDLRARASLAGTATKTTAVEANSPTQSADAPIDIKRLAEDAADGSYPAARRVRETLARLSTTNIEGLTQTVLESGLLPTPREELLKKLLVALHLRDPGLFLDWSMKVLAGTGADKAIRSDFTFTIRSGAEEGLREWTASQPQMAAKWTEANEDLWKAFGAGSMRNIAIAGLLRADPERAYGLLERCTVPECMDALKHGLPAMESPQTLALAQWAATRLEDPEKRRRIARKALFFTRIETPGEGEYLDSIKGTLLELPLSEDDLTWIAVRLALDSVFNISSDLEQTPAKENAWLEKVLPSTRHEYARGALGHFYQPKQALIYLGKVLDEAPSDDLIAGYVESEDMKWHRDFMLMPAGGRHGDTAFRLATRVQDPTLRVSLLVKAWRDLQKDSAPAAQEILLIPELGESDRTALEEELNRVATGEKR